MLARQDKVHAATGKLFFYKAQYNLNAINKSLATNRQPRGIYYCRNCG